MRVLSCLFIKRINLAPKIVNKCENSSSMLYLMGGIWLDFMKLSID